MSHSHLPEASDEIRPQLLCTTLLSSQHENRPSAGSCIDGSKHFIYHGPVELFGVVSLAAMARSDGVAPSIVISEIGGRFMPFGMQAAISLK